MVRFFCFNTNIHYHRSKKVVQPSGEAMSKASEDYYRNQGPNVSGAPSKLPPILKESHDSHCSTIVEPDISLPADHSLEPGEVCCNCSPEANIMVRQISGLKKSQSVGCALDRGGGGSDGTDSGDEIDQDFSPDRFDERNYPGLFHMNDHNAAEEPFSCKDPRTSTLKYDKSPDSDFLQMNTKVVVPHQPIFSTTTDMKQLEDFGGDLANRSPHGYAGDSGHHRPGTSPKISKSSSLPNFGVLSPTSKDVSPSQAYVIHRSRSLEDLNALNEKRKAKFDAKEDRERGDDMLENINNKFEDPSAERYGYESFNHDFGKDWTVSRMDEVNMNEKQDAESLVPYLNALPGKDFKTTRIEEWVSMLDLEESSSLRDMTDPAHSIDRGKKVSYVLGNATTAKLDSKGIHGMEAAKNYVSSLPATSTSAQLTNFGLVVIPFLSAFVNLKTLNLSGNTIVRITSGALPRGLHVLNLAKNNISVIEGLRELTRLRMLDLSYNRILRNGHGLASCSSLKELYLAGNKISEVEGLHRLLKLNVLDLRFNKIATAKCLAQLAANYNSLQAIDLEGNPAQRNVGDEHLKKYLQSILPRLVYFNKKTIRASSSKEAADRSTRKVIASHQLDRSLRPDHKLVRKGSHNLSTGKAPSFSSIHGHRVQAIGSPKQPKDRHGRLPPSGIKESHRQHYLELGSKLLGLRSNLSMRRSRSEGNLGVS